MIMDGLVLIASELNEYIRNRVDLSRENHVFLSSIVDGTGNNQSPKDAITITLTSVEEECTNKAQRFNRVQQDSAYTYSEPELRLNLFIIVSVRPEKNSDGIDKYTDALSLLSMAAHFFQSHRHFDQSKIQNPKVSDDLRRVIVELRSVGFESQSYIWGIHGGQYLPSLLYKVSVIHIHEDTATKEVPVVETVEVNADRGGL